MDVLRVPKMAEGKFFGDSTVGNLIRVCLSIDISSKIPQNTCINNRDLHIII